MEKATFKMILILVIIITSLIISSCEEKIKTKVELIKDSIEEVKNDSISKENLKKNTLDVDDIFHICGVVDTNNMNKYDKEYFFQAVNLGITDNIYGKQEIVLKSIKKESNITINIEVNDEDFANKLKIGYIYYFKVFIELSGYQVIAKNLSILQN